MAGDNQDSSERTQLAGDRTALANERTLAAWWRTAMAGFALALGFAKLFGDVQPAWLVRTGASLLILLGAVILWTALRTYERSAKRIEAEHVVEISRRTLWIGTALLATVAGIIAAAVWMV
jgi:putative membrane protein